MGISSPEIAGGLNLPYTPSSKIIERQRKK
jgi:hypothetical protein